jgi:ribosomal protein S1
MEKFDILEQPINNFKPLAPKSRILNHVYEEYSEAEIRKMYDMYTGDTSAHNYGLKINVGDKITGKVVGETSTDYLFNIGYKDYLRIEKKKGEAEALARYANDENTVSFETDIEILITEVSESPYLIKGSLVTLHKNDTYTDILQNSDEPIEATVLTVLPAGFTLELNYGGYKIPAFMPNILAGVNKLSPEQSQALAGKTLSVMIESYSSDKGTFIASRKKFLKSLIPQEIAKLKTLDANNQPLQYTGVVTGSSKFGVFVEFNECLTGMIHKDNLDAQYKNTYQNVEAGTRINFFIKEIIKDKLFLTQTWKETVWDTVKKDAEYTGNVYDEKSIGILVRLDDETVGLIHTSELEKLGRKPSIGSTVKVKVIAVQKMERKIYLTLAK